MGVHVGVTDTVGVGVTDTVDVGVGVTAKTVSTVTFFLLKS